MSGHSDDESVGMSDAGDDAEYSHAQDFDADADQDQDFDAGADQDQDEDQEEDQDEDEEHEGGGGGGGKVDIPFKCVSATGKSVDLTDGVRAAIRTIVEVKPELDAITKACGQVRKKVTAAKKEVEKFMTKNQVDVLHFGASKYLRVHKERTKVDLKSIKNSQVLTEKQKQKLIAENTKPAVSFKQE
jgi:hypothetical protein